METTQGHARAPFREPGPIRTGDKVFLRNNRFGNAACDIYPELREGKKLGESQSIVVIATDTGSRRKAAHVQASWMDRPCSVWVGGLSLDLREVSAARKEAREAKKAGWAAKRAEKAERRRQREQKRAEKEKAKAERKAAREARKAAKCQSSAS